MANTAISFYDLKAQHAGYEAELLAAAKRVIDSGYYILGPEVETFEAAFATYSGRKYCVSVGNGLDAITLILKALDLPRNKKVVTVANSFIASALAATQAGHPVGLVDCDSAYLLDVAALDKLDPTQVAALLPVHLYGQMADMPRIKAWAKMHKIPVIEDSAQAHGALRDGQSPGYETVAATYSFYPGKNLGALGDAGCVTTDDINLADKLRVLRSYGSVVKYHHELQGTNSRMDPIQAAILGVKLKHVKGLTEKRFALAREYTAGLSNVKGIRTPEIQGGEKTVHVYHQYVIEADRRDELQKHLTDRGIGTLIHYPVPIHKAAAYAEELGRVQAPKSEHYAARILSLPIWPGMSSEMVQTVCSAIKDFYRH